MKKILVVLAIIGLVSFTFKNRGDDVFAVMMAAFEMGWVHGNNSGISGVDTWKEDSTHMANVIVEALKEGEQVDTLKSIAQ